jgi:hypothetical protein
MVHEDRNEPGKNGACLDIRPFGRLSPYSLIIAAFALSRLAYYAAGVRFDTHILLSNFQFLDIALLRTRLWESLYYCHMQPPLMNLWLGLSLKLFGDGYGTAWHILYMAAGLTSGLLLYRLMLVLGTTPRIACWTTVAFLISPGCILYENFPMYEYPMATLLLASCLLLHRISTAPGLGALLAFFTVLAALGWIRALYHPALIAAAALVCAWYLTRAWWKRIAAVATGPFLSLLALYVKNWMVFGLFSSSCWLGFALASCTFYQLSPEDRDGLIQEGKLSPIARYPLAAPAVYKKLFFPDMKSTGIPVLDEEVKTGGYINTNHLVFQKVDLLHREAVKQTLRWRPGAYLRSVEIAFFTYFLPPSHFFQFKENRDAVRPLERWVNLLVFGQIREATGQELRKLYGSGDRASLLLYTGIFLLIGFPLLICYALYRLSKLWKTQSAQCFVLGLVVFHIVYIMVTTNFLSTFETNRYRYPSDPLYVAIFAVAASDLRRRVAQRPDNLHVAVDSSRTPTQAS